MTDSDFMTMDDWVRQSGASSDSDLILQIDIEGGEYETLLNTSDALMGRFRVIVAEFHYLQELWNQPFFSLASKVFQKILQTHHCLHVHPNNCCGTFDEDKLEIPRVCEFTFIRKDRVNKLTPASFFPHPLDGDNTKKPSLVLPECWYK